MSIMPGDVFVLEQYGFKESSENPFRFLKGDRRHKVSVYHIRDVGWRGTLYASNFKPVLEIESKHLQEVLQNIEKQEKQMFADGVFTKNLRNTKLIQIKTEEK